MSALWSPQQREWLQALGHRVLVLAGDETVIVEDPSVVPATRRADERSDQRPDRRLDDPIDQSNPSARSAPVPTAQGRPATNEGNATPAAPSVAAGPLHLALRRATGQRTTRAAEGMLRQLRADADALHGDAVAKRAFWLRLRALRKSVQRS